MSWDDVAALVYLLQLPNANITAIAVAGDGLTHCGPGVTHVRELVANLGHTPIPVACGQTAPLQGTATFPPAWRQNADGFFGLSLPEAPAAQIPVDDSAGSVLDRALMSSSKSVVISLGPMTDLALLLSQHPELRPRVEGVYAMGGALDVPGNEPDHGLAEWNIYIDPLAAQQVLQSGVPVTLIPLDATDDVPVTTLFLDTLKTSNATPATRILNKLFSDPYYYSGAQYFWDPLAAMIATDPRLARFSDEWLSVIQGSAAERGRTIRAAGGAPTRVAVAANDQAFNQQYLRVVSGDPHLSFTIPTSRLDINYGAGRWSVRSAVRTAVGAMALNVANGTSFDVGVVVAKLAPGHSMSEVDAAIKAGGTSPPAWLNVELQVTVPRGHPTMWSVELQHGNYVVIGGGPNIPLQRLSAISVPD